MAFLLVIDVGGVLSGAAAGTIVGSVKDPSGAVVRTARITATQRETGVRRWTTAERDGEFVLQLLPPGDWNVEVEAGGFERVVAPDNRIEVDHTLRFEFTLPIAGSRESTDVRSTAEPLQGEVIHRRPLASLPLNGRQYLDLAVLVPGVIPAPAGTQGLGFSMAGSRSQSNVYLLDGVSHQDTQNNGALNGFRLSEAIEEFDVQTTTPLPEFGRGSGAQINAVTRAGTNEFHGSLFEYIRNSKVDAADFFTNKLGGNKNPLNRNQFGGSLGGPLLQNRTFFFATYEGFQQVAHLVSVTRVPSAAERATVTDAISQRLLNYWPAANAGGALNYISDVRNRDSDNTGLLRIDHRLTGRDQVAARWVEYRGDTIVAGPTPITGGNTGEPSQRAAMLRHTHVFTPLVLNELVAGFSSNRQERTVQDVTVNAASIFLGNAGAPLAGVVNSANDPFHGGLPSITVSGGYASLGANQNFPQGRYTNTVEISDSIAWKSMRFGGQVRRESLRQYLERSSRGTINFASFANFARGMINSSTFRTGNTLAHWRRYPWSIYWQDQIRLRSNLAVDFGVRYESGSPSRERDGRATNFVPGVGPVVDGTSDLLTIDPALTGPAALQLITSPLTLPDSGVHPDRNNFAPMLGLAYSRGVWVVRTGFRAGFDEPFGNLLTSMAIAPPFSLQTSQTANVTQPGAFGWALAFDQNVPLISNVGRQGPGTPTVGVITFQGIDPDIRTPYVYHYHFAVQRPIGRWLSIEAAYQGSSGHRLGVYIDVNQPAVIVRDPTRRGPVAPNEQVFPYPQWGQSQVVKSIGNSNYNGMVLTARSQSRAAGFYQFSWTYGKSLDYNSSYFGTGNLPGEPGAPADSTNLRLEHGPSSFDVRSRIVAIGGITSTVRGNRLSRILLARWKMYGIAVIQSGMPFTVVSGNPDSNGFNQSTAGVSPNGGNRPDILKPGWLPQDNRNPDAAFDTSWFAPALAGRVGTSGRNQYYGPALVNIDAALSRTLKMGERAGIEVRADAFNVFNRTNFGNPIADMSNANFGRITQTLGSAVSNAVGTNGGATGGARQLQLSLRLQF